MSSGLFVVVAGGDPLDAAAAALVPADATIVAADSGADHARAIGLPVHVLIGDLDSVDPATVERLAAAGTDVQRHPAAKDHTDLELAIGYAVERGAAKVLVLGGAGGRLDHFLGNALLLASPAWADVEVVARMGTARVWVIRTVATLTGSPGELLTLLAVNGPARGIWTEGLAYSLAGEDLLPGSSRGLSNVFLSAEAQVRLSEGVLLAVAPGGKFP